MDIDLLFSAAAAPTTKVVDLQTATAVAKELTELRSKVVEINDSYGEKMEVYRAIIEALQNECASEIAPLLDEINEKKELLIDYHKREYEASEDKDKVKSIKLAHGVTLTSRSAQVALSVKDNDAYTEFAERTGLIKTSHSVDWSAMKKQFAIHDGKVIHETTGEVVEFIQVEDKGRTFDVK